MNSAADPTANRAAARSSLAIDNLRAVVILLVLAFHSALAYLNFLPQHPFAFDGAPMLWRAFPVVDAHRWIGFDLFCAWLDVFLMSFFFLLSGLFAWPSLSRKGVRAFLADRVLRLGLPFAVVVGLLMPVALYPTYLQSTTDPSFADFWRQWLALPLWPSGPMWFLWLLLVGDLLVAGLYQLLAGRRDALVRLSAYARRHPTRFLAGVLSGVGARLCPAGADIRHARVVSARPVCGAAVPAVGLRRVFLRRRRDRRLRHRERPRRAGRTAGATVATLADGGAAALFVVGRADSTDDAPRRRRARLDCRPSTTRLCAALLCQLLYGRSRWRCALPRWRWPVLAA